MRKLIFALIAVCSASLHAQTFVERVEKDELVFMPDKDPYMRKAFQVARESLDEFLKLAKKNSPKHSGFALKVAISQGKDTEYFWVTDFSSQSATAFQGIIGNEPKIVDTVELGQQYAFTRKQIVDWIYIDQAERRMVGNFTLCALLTKESPEDAKATKARFNLDCKKVVP